MRAKCCFVYGPFPGLFVFGILYLVHQNREDFAVRAAVSLSTSPKLRLVPVKYPFPHAVSKKRRKSQVRGVRGQNRFVGKPVTQHMYLHPLRLDRP